MSSAVTKVKDFFGIAVSVDGKTVVKLKSDNPMGKASGKRNILGQITHSSLWKNISTFETSRYSAYSVIIGVQSDDSRQVVKGIDRPFIIISAEDLNCKNFAKQLGRTMLEPACVICIETAGLDKNGSARLLRFLKCIKDLFDSRVCVALCASEDTAELFTELIEKHFNLDSSLTSKPAGDSTELDKALEKIRIVEEEKEKLLKENALLRSEVSLSRVRDLEDQLKLEQAEKKEVEESNTSLRAQLARLESENVVQGKKNKQLTDELRKLANDYKMLQVQRNLALPSLEHPCKSNQRSQDIMVPNELVADNIDKEIENSNSSSVDVEKKKELSIIKERLKRNDAGKLLNASLHAYRCIKDLEYSTKFEENEQTKMVKCSVTITKGKIIMNFPTLIRFSGEGRDEKSAKQCAFEQFILLVENY